VDTLVIHSVSVQLFDKITLLKFAPHVHQVLVVQTLFVENKTVLVLARV
jgi:hypothetical protein